MVGRVSDIYVEAFVNATEVESRIRQAVINILGEEMELESQTIEGSFGNPLIVLRAHIHRKKEVECVLARMVSADYFRRSLDRARDRLDENGVYHMRLDKASAYEGEPRLWEGGESVELRLKVVTYPFSYPGALDTFLALASSNGQR